MSIPKGFKALQFACECTSSRGGYSDPWAGIAQNKLLPDGTKEEILNLVAKEPKTIAQLAKLLGRSQPSIHRHINDMMSSELLRESEEWERKYPAERYYEPNFPVFKHEECAEFRGLCEEMSEELVALFEKKRSKLERPFRKTGLAKQGWELSDVTQCLFANMYRRARTQLEQSRLLAPGEKHANGAQWIFWAEEPETKRDKRYSARK